MTFNEYCKNFALAIDAPCDTSEAEVCAVIALAKALHEERKRFVGMNDDALNFMDMRAAMCPSSTWVDGMYDVHPEAQYRYAVALELWLKIQRGDKQYIGQPTPPAKGSVTCTPKPTPIPTPPTRSTSTVIAESS